jgi:RNA polymerase sigma factor for flagellar operon FliA
VDTTGATTDVDDLVKQHISLVYQLAARLMPFVGAHVDRDDLVAFGLEGLFQAARRFDPTRETAFRTFARYRVRGAMLDGLQSLIPTGQKYAPLRQQLRAEETINVYLTERSAEPPAQSEREARERFTAAIRDLATTYALASVTVERLPDTSLPDLQVVTEQLEALHRIKKALQQLPQPERQVLELVYFHGCRLKEVGERLDISPSWASRLHTRGLRNLREILADELALSRPK